MILSTLSLILSVMLIIVGLVLVVINLPGIWLIWLAILLNALTNGFEEVSVIVVIIMFVVSIAASTVDNLAVMWGAKKFGASKWGILGAFLGAIIGLLIGNIFGLILGPFIGALLMEFFIMNQSGENAIKAGIGAVFGFFLGIALKFGIAVTMVVIWITLIT